MSEAKKAPKLSPLEREEKALEDALNSGEIDQREYSRDLRDLERDYREQAHESARDAYDRELERW